MHNEILHNRIIDILLIGVPIVVSIAVGSIIYFLAANRVRNGKISFMDDKTGKEYHPSDFCTGKHCTLDNLSEFIDNKGNLIRKKEEKRKKISAIDKVTNDDKYKDWR